MPAIPANMAVLLEGFRPVMIRYASKLMSGTREEEATQPVDIVHDVVASVYSGQLALPSDPPSHQHRKLLSAIWYEVHHVLRDERRHCELLFTYEAKRTVRRPDEVTASREVLTAVHDAIGTLPSRQGEIARRYFLDGAPAARIAEDLHIAVPTIRAVLRRVRSKLRVALQAYRSACE